MPNHSMPLIEIEKVATTDLPRFLPAERADAESESSVKGHSMAVGYVVQGWLVAPITIGESVKVVRVTRNGVSAPGFFCTSQVVACDETRFSTINSIYRWRLMDVRM